jgi:hypothetical protein
MRLRPEPELADTIFTLAAASNNLPAVEIMWGLLDSGQKFALWPVLSHRVWKCISSCRAETTIDWLPSSPLTKSRFFSFASGLQRR